MYETLTGIAPFAADNSIKTILRRVTDALDARAAALFSQHEYEKAIDLLMFNLHTYQEDGNPKHESYLADCTQHVGKA